jgi:hypothetical protein
MGDMTNLIHPVDPSKIEQILQQLENLYGDNAELISILNNKIHESSLALFLGAGISIDSNIPDWQGLIRQLTSSLCRGLPKNNLLLSEVYYQLNKMTPLILAQQIEDELEENFIPEVKRILYNHLIPSEIIMSLVSLLKRSPLINRIITYNYDDLLEDALQREKIPFGVVLDSRDEISVNLTNVFHIHGYIPRDSVPPQHVSITLGEGKYYHLCNNPYEWANVVQLTTLFQYNAFFIGFSFNDPNVRRFLNLIQKHMPQKKHYAILRKLHADDLIEAVCFCAGIEKKHRNMAVRKLSEITSYFDWLFQMQSGLYKRLGLEILWINQYSDIPELINRIYTN